MLVKHYLTPSKTILLTVIFIVIIATSIFQGEIVAQFYSFQFIYVPIGGMYAILVGQIVSEFASKSVLYYHNRVIASFENERNIKKQCERLHILQSASSNQHLGIDEIESANSCLAQAAGDNIDHNNIENREQRSSLNDRYALSYSKFTRPHRGDCGKLRIRSSVKYGYMIFCLLVIAMILIGCILPSFSYDISGLLGVALNFGRRGQDNSTGTNSVFSIISSLMDSARLLDHFKYVIGLGFISTFLILTVVIIPMIEIMMLLLQWSVPMQQGSLLRLQYMLYIMESWQCMEVYFVAVLASAIQVKGISQFFAETYCTTLTSLLRSLAYWGFLSESDDQCISMEATINASSLSFLVAVVVLFFLKVFARDALRHRVQEENNQLQIVKSNSSDTQNANQTELKVNINDLRPLPVHFTDRFRWALRSD
jgi:Paraquat-inducible protein A